ncbi:hypothetical protein HY968_00385 [Candidatus Kaiserbacteria bacterium]|nr:hypothetical protein [Candidatus Kaiserbacteria bacterium]
MGRYGEAGESPVARLKPVRSEAEIIDRLWSRIEADIDDISAWAELEIQVAIMYRSRVRDKIRNLAELRLLGSTWRELVIVNRLLNAQWSDVA